MIRVAVAVQSRAIRATVERALGQRASLSVVPRSADPDVLLVDAVEWAEQRSGTPAARGPTVIALAEAPDDALVAATLAAGARGVIPYAASQAELTAAVEAAAAGLVVLSPELGALTPGRAGVNPPKRAHDRGSGLTERERDVLVLLAAGLHNRAIAARLGISENTVKSYVASILDKLGASGRAEAVAVGVRRGLIMV